MTISQSVLRYTYSLPGGYASQRTRDDAPNGTSFQHPRFVERNAALPRIAVCQSCRTAQEAG